MYIEYFNFSIIMYIEYLNYGSFMRGPSSDAPLSHSECFAIPGLGRISELAQQSSVVAGVFC